MQNTALELDEDYALGEVLGSGGMGVVYSAIQKSLGRRVAIKIPHAELAGDPFVSSRFRAEARASSQLDHRNIARVIDFGGRDGSLFLVMQNVAGVSLEGLVLDSGPTEPGIAADLCGQILSALDATHIAGVIHADIKSGNVLVETLADGALRAVVIDFGLARFCDEPSTHDPRLISGTPDYLAPELIRGGVPTVSSDLYAAGVVLYELLTGSTPFGGGTSAEILDRQLADVVVPPSLRCPELYISRQLEAVVMRALAKDPDARFASATEFANALRDATPMVAQPPQRFARGTQAAAFSTSTVTRDWQRERLVVLPTAGESRGIQQVRIIVKAAIASGDGDAIVTSYLELVGALIEGHKMDVAVVELERGLAILRPGTVTAEIWRLQLCLAGLYSGLGLRAKARRAAVLGHDDAVQAASTIGEARACDLLARLAQPGPSRRS